MASFTDQILGFNPYVQQLPVDAMVKVGMQKQAQYDQGVQKIQSYVDNVAGMSVLRPVDQQYLKSKVNELGSRLKTVAAGDFSNSQLVNSVGGMVGQVVKDPTVMAAMYSTQNDAKNQSEMDADEKAGKLTPHARYFYERKRNAYLNDPNLKNEDGRPVTFGGKYQRSWDLDKNIIDAVDAVGDKKFSAKQIFKTDPSTGAILYNTQKVRNPKTGKVEEVQGTPILSEYATLQIKEGKFSENISAAIDGVLSRPEAQQELMMRGVYTYRGYDDINDFVVDYEKEKNKGISLLESKKLELMNKVLLETDPDKKEQLKALVTNTENELSTLSKYEDPRIKQALETKDLDAYKSMIYTQRQKNNWMEAYVTESNTIDYVESAPWQAHRQKIKDERDWWSTQDASSRGWAAVDISRQNLALEKDKWKYDPTNPDAQINQAKPYEGGATPQDLYNNWISSGAQISDDYDSSKKQFVIDYMKALNYGNGRTYTDDQIARSAYQYEKDRPGYFERQFQVAKAAVQKNPTNPAFSNLITALPGVNSLEKKVENFSREVDELNNDPEVLAASGGKKASDLEKNFKTTKFKFQGFGGKEITLTPKDQINLAIVLATSKGSAQNNRAEQDLKASTGMTSVSLLPIVGQIAETGKSFKEAGFTSFFTDPLYATDKRTTEHRQAAANIRKYWDVIGTDVTSAKEKVLKEKMKGNSPLVFELFSPGAKTPEKESTIDRLKTVLANKGVSDDDVSKFSSFYSGTSANKEGYTVNIGVNRGGVAGGKNDLTLDLYSNSGLEKSLIISKKDADYIKGTTLNIPSPTSDVVKRVNWNTKTGSTNSSASDLNNPNAYRSAYYQSDDFYSLNRPDLLGADIKVNNLGQPNVYFYVKDKNGNSKAAPFKASASDILPGAFTSIDAADAFIKGIRNSAQIDNILKNANIK
jgi:hypothetical protein